MAEQAVKPVAELQPAAILESIAHPIVAFDKQWRYLYVSARAARALGKSVDELLGRCMWDVFPGAADSGFQEACARAWESGRPVTVERYSRILQQWVESYIFPFAEGACTEWRDVTARKLTQKALSEAAQRLNAHMDNSPLAIVEFDPQFRICPLVARRREVVRAGPPRKCWGGLCPQPGKMHQDDAEKVRQVSAGHDRGPAPAQPEREPQLPQGRLGGRVRVVQLRHLRWRRQAELYFLPGAGYYGEGAQRGAAAARAEIGERGAAGGRHRARFQQPADGDHGQRQHRAGTGGGGRGAPDRRGGFAARSGPAGKPEQRCWPTPAKASTWCGKSR